MVYISKFWIILQTDLQKITNDISNDSSTVLAMYKLSGIILFVSLATRKRIRFDQDRCHLVILMIMWIINYLVVIRKILLILLIFDYTTCFSQETDSTKILRIKHHKGSAGNYYSDLLNAYKKRLLTIGNNCEFVNSAFGIQISNGYDELPLSGFEEVPENLMFKINAQSDFVLDYSFGANFGWNFKRIFFTTEYLQNDFPSQGLFYRNIGLSVMTSEKIFIRRYIFKLSYQVINGSKNLGATIGLEKTLFYRRLYTGLSLGYYIDYFKYNFHIQGFIYKKLGLRIDYERMDNYDFLNFGLFITFKR